MRIRLDCKLPRIALVISKQGFTPGSESNFTLKRDEFTEPKGVGVNHRRKLKLEATHAIDEFATLCSGKIGLPASSFGAETVKVAKIEAAIRKSTSLLNWRPGQILWLLISSGKNPISR